MPCFSVLKEYFSIIVFLRSFIFSSIVGTRDISVILLLTFTFIQNIQSQDEAFIFLFVDLGNGSAECPDTTIIQAPLLILNIEAESSLDIYSSGNTSSAISCFGEEDAFAQIQISREYDDDVTIETCLDGNENEIYWEVNWFLDNTENGLELELDNFDIFKYCFDVYL